MDQFLTPDRTRDNGSRGGGIGGGKGEPHFDALIAKGEKGVEGTGGAGIPYINVPRYV